MYWLLCVILLLRIAAGEQVVLASDLEDDFILQHVVHIGDQPESRALVHEFDAASLDALVFEAEASEGKYWGHRHTLPGRVGTRGIFDEPRLPDLQNIKTVATLAKMSSIAYKSPEEYEEWYKVGWNATESFGWEEPGVRGHVFANRDNSSIIVSIKGTSAAIIGGGKGTARSDKFNDNLFFSCCCARVDWSWTPVCDCYQGGYECGGDCLEQAVMEEGVYYSVLTIEWFEGNSNYRTPSFQCQGLRKSLYNNITELYPTSEIWLVGHSLGGALVSFLSLSYGVPSVAFEAPGDLLAAQRLHLPTHANPNLTTHIFHTADPIAMGVCNGKMSTCSVAGFALETRCHTGRSIIYDTVGVLGWSVDIRTHRIDDVIEKLMIPDWAVNETTNEPLGIPPAEPEEDCVDCFRWTYT